MEGEAKDREKELNEIKTKHFNLEAENSKISKSYRVKSNQSRTYEENLTALVQKIDKELECPLLLIPMDIPTITPSGYTVDGFVMDELISSQGVDPFDWKSLCKEKIVNKFAVKIKNIISQYK